MLARFKVISFIMVVCLWSLCYGDTISVPTDCSTLQLAVQEANSGDTIILETDEGPFSGPGFYNIEWDAAQKNNLTITSDDLPYSRAVIDCYDNNNKQWGLYIYSTVSGKSVTIEGIIIKNASIGGGSSNGGAILCENVDLSLLNCYIKDCYAGGSGGAISIENTLGFSLSPSIYDCYFSGNDADDGSGGAIYCSEALLDIRRTNFKDCSAGLHGGAVYVEKTGSGSGFLIDECDFSGHVAGGSGGAIYASLGSTIKLDIDECDIDDCLANYGGGVRFTGGELEARECTINGCRAYGYGGGVYVDGAKVDMTLCKVTGNTGDQDGGGLWLNDSSGSTLCTLWFCENEAPVSASGGAIALTDSDLLVKYCTFAKNDADMTGGAIACYSSELAVVDTILAYDDAAGGDELALYAGSEVYISHCCVYGGESMIYASNSNYSYSYVIESDPLLSSDDLHISSNSPCVDQAYTSTCSVDIDGSCRSVGGATDIGADELDCFPVGNSQYSDWALLGKPSCWCAPNCGSGYQCDGDADGSKTGYPTYYRVATGDLTLIQDNWKKMASDPSLNPCADIDHEASFFPAYRVFIGDLNILIANWQKTDAQLPGDCPRD